MTLRELVAQTEAELSRSPHPEKARLDADTLLLYLLQQNRAWLLAHWSDPASANVMTAYLDLVSRRRAGEPIQYITGKAEFFGLPFVVTPDVLIPRPETEHLVEEVMRLAAHFETETIHIADIGTGSGAIAVALAHDLPKAKIVATDISVRALKIARENAERNQVADRIEFLEGTLLKPLAGRSFHIIASNPPYVPQSDSDSLSVEVSEHEPHSALFAGDEGLDIYRKLIPHAHKHLDPNGWIVLEIGYGQQNDIQDLLAASGYREIKFVPDYQGIARVAVAQSFEVGPRVGWAEEAKQLAATGDNKLAMPEFPNEEDAELHW